MLEEQRRPNSLQRIVEALACIDVASDAMKLQEISLDDSDDHLSAFARRESAAEIADRILGSAVGSSFGDALEREAGSVADEALDILKCNRRPAEAIKRQLFDFGSRQCAIGAEPALQQRAGVVLDRE